MLSCRLAARLYTTYAGQYRCLAAALLALPLAAAGQHLEAVGLVGSLTVTQTVADQYFVRLPVYTVATHADGSLYDETGTRLAAFARWRVGKSRFFVQPEAGYTSSRGQTYFGLYTDPQTQTGPYYFTLSHRVRRWELAGLGGVHLNRHLYVLLGPVLALNLRDPPVPEQPWNFPNSGPVYNSLFRSVERVQALAQLGLGLTAGRFDFNLRLEHSLMPYSRTLVYQGEAYGYRQHIRQGLLSAGILLYKPRAGGRRPAE